jgi:hypothetical protein
LADKTKKTRTAPAVWVSMLGLNPKLGKRVSVIHSSFKTCFDKRLKMKRPKIAQAILGFYAWIEPKIGKTRQRNPLITLSLIGKLKS